MKFRILIFLLIANQAFAQSKQETELRTSIEGVTVFLKGAQITRVGIADIRPGRSTIIIKSLSPHIDSKSIQVKAKGSFTVLSVNRKLNYLNELNRDVKADSLNHVMDLIEGKISKKNSRLEVLTEMQSLLNVNKKLGGDAKGSTISELKEAIDFYNSELSNIKLEELGIDDGIDSLKNELTKLQKQLGEIRTNFGKPTSEIMINVDATSKTKGNFTLTYLVANAGWHPKYDLRVKDVTTPLKLTYKAEVYQSTGVDWNKVKLKFSNGNPNQSGVAPELSTWYLNYHRNTVYNRSTYGINSNSVRAVAGRVVGEKNEPIPGVNVILKGSTIGTITDLEGNYSLTLPNNATHLLFSYVGFASHEVPITKQQINVTMVPDVAQLNEIVVVGYGGSRRSSAMGVHKKEKSVQASSPLITTIVENQTTVEFEVDIPYSIKSNGENLTVNLRNHEIETSYEYYAVPKLGKDAFLIARIINWDQFNLLEGEANLYFEDSYVGRSILNARAMTDTLDISLGRDKNILIGRGKADHFSKKITLGSNKIESRGFNIIARNKKNAPIKLTIFDQIPISAMSDISVEAVELSKGKLDKKTGQVTWEIELLPQKQTELKLKYEVKYPKNEILVLE